MRIGLLFGGKSFEHDISIISTNIIYHALKEKYKVSLLYIDKTGNFTNPKDINIEKFSEGKKFRSFSFCKKGIKVGCKFYNIDVIINVMHGQNGEDGTGAVLANLFDIPFVGTNNISSGLLLDKHFTYAILRNIGVDTINTKPYLKGEKISGTRFPLIVKPARLGSSIGINKINSINQLDEKIKKSFEFDNKIVIQPFIKEFRECNQAAYFYQDKIVVSNVEEVFKSDEILSFDDKYLSTKTVKKHAFITEEDLIEKISLITKKIYHNLELSGIVRIDYMIVDERIYVNEINTTPGSLAYYLFEEKILNLLEKQIHHALLNFQNQKTTSFTTSVLNQNYTYKK